MTKPLTPEQVATKTAEALQPVHDFNGAANVKQTPMPTNTPPASPETRRALGIVKPLWHQS